MKRIYFLIAFALLTMTQMWADNAKIEGEALGNEVKSWQGNHVTFTLSTGAAYSTDWGNSHLDLTGDSEHTITWAVDPCYKIQVTGLNYRIGNSSVRTATFYINGVEVGSSGLSTGKNLSYDGLNLGSEGSIVFKSSRDIDLYNFEVVYTITPYKYSVIFHADDATSGSMENQAFNYGSAQKLTANAFVRTYTVTYNADGGEGIEPSAVAAYEFAGWAKSAEGAAEFADAQEVNNLSNEDNGEVNLFAKWNSVSVTLPEPTKAGKLFNGWYNGENYIGKAGDAYTPTADIELTAHWADKLTPQFSLDKAEIELEQKAVLTLTNVNNPEIQIVPEGIVEYNAENGELTGVGVGKATILIAQAATETITEKADALELNVTKKTASLAALLAEVEQNAITLNPGQKASVAFNKVSDAEVEVSLVSGGEFVAYKDGEVEALSQEGTAVFSASLAETETFKSAALEFSVEVARAAEATDCYVLANQEAEMTARTGNTTNAYEWNDENSAGVVRFQVSHVNISVDPGYKVQQLVNGEWEDATEKRSDFSSSYSWKSVELNPAAKGVRFWGSGSLNNYFKNVSVTRKGFLNASAEEIKAEPNADGAGVLKVEYSIANGGDLKILCDNDKFSLESNVIENVDCKSGSANINITFAAQEAEGTHEAHIVIYNGVYYKELAITAKVAKSSGEDPGEDPEDPSDERNAQEITWEQELGTVKMDAAIQLYAEASSGLDVVFQISDESIVSLGEDNWLEFHKPGTVTITAKQPGNETTWKPAKPIVKELTVLGDDVASSIDETAAEAKAVKVLRDGQIFILRDGKIYTISGLLVK